MKIIVKQIKKLKKFKKKLKNRTHTQKKTVCVFNGGF